MHHSRIGIDHDLQTFLEGIPLFSTLSRAQLDRLAARFEPIWVEKGAVICREGEPGDAMYIIKSGAVGVYVQRDHAEVFVNYLHRGEFFGEMSLLVHQARNATIRVLFDAELYRLRQDAFEQLLIENPSIGLYLSRLYAHRFAQTNQDISQELLPTFYAMTATHAGLGKSFFLYTVAYHLAREAHKRVLIVELQAGTQHRTGHYGLVPTACPDTTLVTPFSPRYQALLRTGWYRHPQGFMAFLMPQTLDRRLRQELATHLPGVMALLRKQFHLVLFNLADPFDPLGSRVLRLCDTVLLLINNTPDALPQVHETLSAIYNIRGSRERLKVGVSHMLGERGLARETLCADLQLAEIPAIWVPRTPAALARQIDTEQRFPIQGPRALARELGRIRVALVLGAGGARGWAHLGVLKVFEAEGIPMDMIVGSSIGALVGGIYARMASIAVVQKRTIERFPSKLWAQWRIFDYTIPFSGLLGGKKIFRMLREGLEDAHFAHLLIPTYVVAVDILTGEEVLLERGPLSPAIMASIAIPGILPPVSIGNRWLMDGGLVNPVPADVALQKGADIVISVSVARKREPRKPQRRPGILSILYRTLNIVHAHMVKDFTNQSDIVLYPDVHTIALGDFHRGRALMEAGVQACRARLQDIQQTIASKSRPTW